MDAVILMPSLNFRDVASPTFEIAAWATSNIALMRRAYGKNARPDSESVRPFEDRWKRVVPSSSSIWRNCWVSLG
jgi:hypothetical protein